jgi:hypothetical protein
LEHAVIIKANNATKANEIEVRCLTIFDLNVNRIIKQLIDFEIKKGLMTEKKNQKKFLNAGKVIAI